MKNKNIRALKQTSCDICGGVYPIMGAFYVLIIRFTPLWVYICPDCLKEASEQIGKMEFKNETK